MNAHTRYKNKQINISLNFIFDPIFEDEIKMNALRNSAYRLVTQMSVVKPTQLAARSIGAQMASHLTKSAASVEEHRQQQQQQPNLFTTSQKSNIGARFAQLNFNLPQP